MAYDNNILPSSRAGFLNSNMQHILDSINPGIGVVYIGIGASMEHYMFPENADKNLVEQGYKQIITPETNQHQPIFLNKFPGRQVIILIDPNMEQNLKFTQGGNLGVVVNLPYFRMYSNSMYIVFCINGYFEYNDPKAEYFPEDFLFMANIIDTCLRSNVKMVLQDYTGKDTKNVYSKFVDILGSDMMYPNVLFDCTCSNGECFYQFSESSCSLDGNGNFIQEAHIRLDTNTHDRNSNLFYRVFKERVRVVMNELSWKYIQLLKNDDCDFTFPDSINYLFPVYNIEFEPKQNKNYIVSKVGELIQSMIQDIVNAKGQSEEVSVNLMQSISNRSDFIKGLTALDF